MGNTLDKPLSCDETAKLDLPAGTSPPHFMDEEEDDDDDWYSTSSFGSHTAQSPTAVTAVEELFLVNATTGNSSNILLINNQDDSNSHHHGVRALREAAAERQRKRQSQGCAPFNIQQSPWWQALFPKQPLLTSVVTSSSSSASDNHDQDSEENDDGYTSSSSSIQQQQQELQQQPQTPRKKQQIISADTDCSTTESITCSPSSRQKDNRSGMLLWTTRSCAASPASTASSASSSSSASSTWFPDEMEYTPQEQTLSAIEPTEASDLTKPRHVWIVTTAALPWMTGTAVNPLLRAASLWQRYSEYCNSESNSFSQDDFSITLVLPWLCRSKDRVQLYGEEWHDKTVEDQEAYIREWIRDRAGMPGAAQTIGIQWYASHYHPALSSIFAVDDVCDACQDIPPNAVCVLEEPEHLNCYRAPGKASWRQRFSHVVGIVHTNYRAYAQAHASGLVTGPLVGALFASLVRAYCDKVVKLSDVLQSYAPEKETTSNVHGIRSEFLQVPPPSGNKVYFIGKLLWAKGLDKMLSLQSHYKKATGAYWPMDVYGSGPEQDEIQNAFHGRRSLSALIPRTSSMSSMQDDSSSSETSAQSSFSTRMPVEFMGRLDHAALPTDYKIFVNPSITEVLCTTTAEALAMGKFVIIPHHSSNHFFTQFPNCLQYKSRYEFCVLLKYALTHEPTPLSETHRHTLTWQAATDRFFKASAVSLRDAARRERIAGKEGDERLAKMHEDVCKGHTGGLVRKILHGDDPLKKTIPRGDNARQ